MDKEFDIDWAALEEPLKKYNLAVTDERSVRELIIETITEWYEDDKETFTIIGVELNRIDSTVAGNYKYIIDLVARVKKPNSKMLKLGIVEGDIVLIDWKTTALNLSNSYGTKKFSATYSTSFQWKTYTSYYPEEVKLFIYRGISKEIGGGVTEVYLKPFPAMKEECDTWLIGVKKLMDSQFPFSQWAKVMPEGCAKFECPHVGTCQQGTPLQYLVEIQPKPHLSYSAIMTFLTCPERYRRDRLVQSDEVDDLGTDSARVGRAFHELIAIIYSKLQEN